MFGLQLVKMILGKTRMSKINENFEKIREFVYVKIEKWIPLYELKIASD